MNESLNLKISELVEQKLKQFSVPVRDNNVKLNKQSRKFTEEKNEQLLALLKTLVTGNIDEAVEQVFEEYGDELDQIYEPNVINTVKTQKKELLTNISEQLVAKNVKKNMPLLNKLDQSKNIHYQVQPELIDIGFLYAKHQFFSRYGKLIQRKLRRGQENQDEQKEIQTDEDIEQPASQNASSDDIINETGSVDKHLGSDKQTDHRHESVQFKKDMHKYNIKL
ncbi:hypothetical protein ACO0QE_001752 [Hanseniaspora vineae]